MELARFPEFESLSMKHGPFVESFMSSYPQYSEFSFTNLFAWNIRGATKISRSKSGLILSVQNHKTKRQYATFMGTSGKSSELLILQLLSMRGQKHQAYDIRLVPEIVIDSLKRHEGFIVEEDRDNFDYILSARYHAELAGRKNQKRRYLTKKFLEKNADRLIVRKLDLSDSTSVTDIRDCMYRWIAKSGKDPEMNEAEQLAIMRVLQAKNGLSIQALGLYINGVLRAFSIFESLHDATGIIHFEKCDISYRGMTQYLRQCVAKEFLSNRISWINYEQDLGIAGLRKSKLMLHPVNFLKKYTITAIK